MPFLGFREAGELRVGEVILTQINILDLTGGIDSGLLRASAVYAIRSRSVRVANIERS